jgi:hypothetical protein
MLDSWNVLTFSVVELHISHLIKNYIPEHYIYKLGCAWLKYSKLSFSFRIELTLLTNCMYSKTMEQERAYSMHRTVIVRLSTEEKAAANILYRACKLYAANNQQERWRYMQYKGDTI